jgi:hypothetical protein
MAPLLRVFIKLIVMMRAIVSSSSDNEVTYPASISQRITIDLQYLFLEFLIERVYLPSRRESDNLLLAPQ